MRRPAITDVLAWFVGATAPSPVPWRVSLDRSVRVTPEEVHADAPGTDTPAEPFTLIEWLATHGQADRLKALSYTHDKSGAFPINPELRVLVDGDTLVPVT